MLRELSSYENLGTPGFFSDLLKRLKASNIAWSVADVRKFYKNRIVDGQSMFDGCLPLAEALKLVQSNSDGILIVDSTLPAEILEHSRIGGLLMDRLLNVLKNDDEFLNIMSPRNVSFDLIYHSIQIDRAAFTFKYNSFRHLLIALDFLKPHPDSASRKYFINPRYRRLFDKRLLPEIRKRKIGIERLEEVLERRQINGAEAEEFVLRYERHRLAGHTQIELIQLISDYDVGAGYDLISFENDQSVRHDRFIEVKSHDGSESFYWSANEVEQARIRKSEYFLYLVDRSRISRSEYSPLIIQNPYEVVFLDEQVWRRAAKSWRFSR